MEYGGADAEKSYIVNTVFQNYFFKTKKPSFSFPYSRLLASIRGSLIVYL